MKKLLQALIFIGLFQCINLDAKCEWCAKCYKGNWVMKDADENGNCPSGYHVCAQEVGGPGLPLAPCPGN